MSQTPRAPFQFAEIAELVSRKTGLSFPENRQSSIDAAIKRAMKRVGVTDITVYAELIARGDLAMDDLLSELTIGETYFFREPAQFQVLRNEIIPGLTTKDRHRRAVSQGIRAWSAACASGEEAYSLAILLQESVPERHYTVLGTDLARARLSSARRARYRKWSLRGMTDDKLSKYFRARGDTYELLSQFREHVEFQYLNLAEDLYPAISTGVWGMDIILCRNVLIYFDRNTVTRVGTRLIESLSDDGWLLLGASDPVLSDLVRCDVVQTAAGLVYRKASAGSRQIVHRLMPTSQPVVKPSANSSSRSPFVSIPEEPSERPTPQPTPEPGSTLSGNPSERSSDPGPTPTEEAGVIASIRDLANRGLLEEAGRECAAALDRYRLSSELLYLHAVLLAQAERPHDSAAAARRALYLDRTMIVAHLALATAYARMGTPHAARRALRNAEKLLAEMAPDAIVPASDGESAGRLLAMVRVQHSLLLKAA